jgi:hypothetical protein
MSGENPGLGGSKDYPNETEGQAKGFKLIKKKNKEKSPSPVAGLSENFNSASKPGQPIIAKDNFVIAHKNLVPGVLKLVQKQQQEEIMMGKVKEVDEWLDATG